jgi:hypothetical protein
MASDVQIVLITQAGLELPLVESPDQVDCLLEVVSEMAANTKRGTGMQGPTVGDRRPHPVRVEQVFDRVRVVVQRRSTTSGDAA